MANGAKKEAESTRTEARDAPAYLARYRERVAEGMPRPASDGTPFYLRRFRSRVDTTRSREVGSPSKREEIEVHLVRHGQTQGYTVDGGLTPLGAWQARRRGQEISQSIEAGETVVLVSAKTHRALRTAEFMRSGIEDGLALWEKVARVSGPDLVEELQNWRVHLPAGPKELARASREYQVESERHERMGTEPRPQWLDDMDRFWQVQLGDGDPQGYWLTTPLVSFEPPALAARRYWAGIERLARERESADRIVCAVHSGPMRAFAATALGYDLGEPNNTEEVRVRLGKDLRVARVTYRGHARDVQVPVFAGQQGWGAEET